jgi:predicted nucleic acid-binding protein
VKLVADANILVAELTRSRGRALVTHPGLELFVAERAWGEARHELAKRFAAIAMRSGLPAPAGNALLEEAVALAEAFAQVIPDSLYAHLKDEALRRVPRDPDDWPTVALALALNADIWTQDGDFLGCGVATWSTATLQLRLGA